MKIIEKIKKIFLSIEIFCLTLMTRVFAREDQALYGVLPPAPKSEPEKLSYINIVWNILRIFIIPLALIIGLIIYFKKSKSSVKVKIFFTILSIIIVLLIYFIVNMLI